MSLAPVTPEETRPKKLGFVIDLLRCIGCDTCIVGCKMEHDTPEGQFRLQVLDSQENPDIERPTGVYPDLDMFWLPTMCHHCTDAPCVQACPTRALFRDEGDGLVLLDKDKCIGCQRCGEECPYDALSFDPQIGTADKCSACEHRLVDSLDPVCVSVCPTRALHFGDLNDPDSDVSRYAAARDTQHLHEAAGANPQIIYTRP